MPQELNLITKKYLTVSELAEYFQLSVETVYLYARTGVLPATRIGKHWRFSIDRLSVWADKQANETELPIKTLVLDNDPDSVSSLQHWTHDAKGVMAVCLDKSQLDKLLKKSDYDIIFFDPTSTSFDGLKTFEQLVVSGKSAELVLMSREFDPQMMTNALTITPLTVLSKPLALLPFERILETVRKRKSP